jgi:hypothetical protein
MRSKKPDQTGKGKDLSDVSRLDQPPLIRSSNSVRNTACSRLRQEILMPIDSYSPCPCGSGKKLKFCKCVDQPQDLEAVIRLIEGGQALAALDRINQLLAKTPNTAWLLAIKSELALSMEVFETQA